MSWVETARLTVEKIKKKRVETEELVHGTDCEKSELSEKRGIHLAEASRLYKKRGWVQIFSGYLNQSIYLVRDLRVTVPDPTIPKYTQKEMDALRGLNIDELKTMCEAKQLFRGTKR